MPSPLRHSKKVWILFKRVNEKQEVVGVCTTFRSAYKIALFELGISDPCLSELRARRAYRKFGRCLIWNLAEFQTLEEAMWSPVGKIAWFEEVPVKRT